MLGKDELYEISKRLNGKTAAVLRTGNKELKQTVNSTWQPTMGPVLMEMQEILKQLPSNIKAHERGFTFVFDNSREAFDERNAEHAKKLFGKAVTPLTMELAKKFAGKRVWVLEGQRWWDAASKKICNNPLAKWMKVSEMTLMREQNGRFMVQNHTLRNLEYELYEYDGVLSSGSGADPVYIFTKKGVERLTGTVKQQTNTAVRTGPRGGLYSVKNGKKTYLSSKKTGKK